MNSYIQETLSLPTGEQITRNYRRGKFLGRGGFASVYELTAEETNKIYAAKIFPKSKLMRPSFKQKLLSEITIQASLRHRHVVSLKHYFEDSDNVYLLLELCKNQTLSDLLKRRKRLTELEVQSYLLQIVLGLDYVHSKRIVHRDIKASNIFINNRMEIKLGDFGLACRMISSKRFTICGTPNYIAPEVLDGKSGHSYGADIWSLGVLAYTLMVGRPPFVSSNVQQTYNLIKMNALSFPEDLNLSEDSKNIVYSLLRTDPERRISLKALLKHPFFSRISYIPRVLPMSSLAIPPSEKFVQLFCSGMNKKRKKTVCLGSTLVVKWADFSSKFGLGYLLSNGSYGVCFNDSTTIVTQEDNFLYGGQIYPLESFPKELYKKVNILTHFKRYLGGSAEEYNENLIWVLKWKKISDGIMFRLSTDVIQFSFQDSSEVIVEKDTVTYVDRNGERYVVQRGGPVDDKESDMYKKVKYAENILKGCE